MSKYLINSPTQLLVGECSIIITEVPRSEVLRKYGVLEDGVRVYNEVPKEINDCFMDWGYSPHKDITTVAEEPISMYVDTIVYIHLEDLDVFLKIEAQ